MLRLRILPLFFPVAATLACAPVLAQDCRLDQAATATQVTHVHDGDTLRLTDGRNVRLIGIDTPELGRQGQANQPYAEKARNHLRQLLARHDKHVLLRYGHERRDRYGRTLAHVFLPDGRSVAENLLERGLATALKVSPNTWNLDCYFAVESQARDRRIGIWSQAGLQPLAASRVTRSDEGYRVIQGVITRLSSGGGARWLTLDSTVAVRIADHDLARFPEAKRRLGVGDTVEVRGMLYRRKGQLRVTVREPEYLTRL